MVNAFFRHYKIVIKGLTAVLVLIFLQLPFALSSFGALYDSDPALQSSWNSTGNSDGEAPTSTTDLPSDKAAHILTEKIVVPTDNTVGPGTTSDVAENLQHIMEPIPGVAWLFALGVIGVVALKRRRRRG